MAKGKEEGLLSSVMKHLVAVSMLDIPKNIDEGDSSLEFQPSNILFSSFIVCVNKIWFLITAGHILKDIEDTLKYCETKKEWGNNVEKFLCAFVIC